MGRPTPARGTASRCSRRRCSRVWSGCANLNADDVYEKFQVVVRRSPYELRYSDLHVWAVKPSDMVSDIIGRLLADANAFSAVTRELGDTRPDYTLGGELHAIEIYDSNDVWVRAPVDDAHPLPLLQRRQMWSFSYDQRKPVTNIRVLARRARALRAPRQRRGREPQAARGGRSEARRRGDGR